LASPFPYVKKEAISSLLNSKGLTYAFSVATASSNRTSPIVLEKIVKRCVDELIEDRRSCNFEKQLPDCFYEAVRNPNTPREALLSAILKLCDPRWQADMTQLLVMKSLSKITDDCLMMWNSSKKNDAETVLKDAGFETPSGNLTDSECLNNSHSPKPIRRMGDMEGNSPE
jgi:hypothetical protein